MVRRAFLGFLVLGALATHLATPARAAPRTMIADYTGLDCTTNVSGPVYEKPDVNSHPVANLDSDKTVHILGGKQFGPFVAIPGTDEEFARTWLHIKFGGKTAWIQSGAINCGG